jgi:hypothetical protein
MRLEILHRRVGRGIPESIVADNDTLMITAIFWTQMFKRFGTRNSTLKALYKQMNCQRSLFDPEEGYSYISRSGCNERVTIHTPCVTWGLLSITIF